MLTQDTQVAHACQQLFVARRFGTLDTAESVEPGDDLRLKLRVLRHRKGLQAKAVAAMAEVAPSQLSRWENQKEILPDYQAERLATALGMTVEDVRLAPTPTPDEVRRTKARPAGTVRFSARKRLPHQEDTPMSRREADTWLDEVMLGEAKTVWSWDDPAAAREFRDRVRAVLTAMERERFQRGDEEHDPAKRKA